MLFVSFNLLLSISFRHHASHLSHTHTHARALTAHTPTQLLNMPHATLHQLFNSPACRSSRLPKGASIQTASAHISSINTTFPSQCVPPHIGCPARGGPSVTDAPRKASGTAASFGLALVLKKPWHERRRSVQRVGGAAVVTRSTARETVEGLWWVHSAVQYAFV